MVTPYQSINELPIPTEAKQIIADFITKLFATGVDSDWYDEIAACGLKELCGLHNDTSGMLLQKKNADTYQHFLDYESSKRYKLLNQVELI